MSNADRRTLLWFSFLTSLGLTPFLIAAYAQERNWMWLFGAVCGVVTTISAALQLRTP